MTTPKALIFDLDGTLADSMDVHWQAWREQAQLYGLTLSEERFYQMGGIPTERIAAILAREQAVAVDALAFRRDKEASFHRNLHRIRPIEEVVAVARESRGKIPMAVATGSLRSGAAKVLGVLGIADWFDAVVCDEDVSHPKPDPEIFLTAARRLGVAPEFCTVYEDAPAGIKGARDAGMQVVDVNEFLKLHR